MNIETTELIVGPKGRQGFLSLAKRTIANIKAYRFFIHQLVRIRILGDFKRSFLGILWLFIMPIVAVIVWILLNGAGIVAPGETDIPYPAFVLLSTSIWGFFAEIYRSTSTIFSNNGRMMIMARFPHETLLAERIIVHIIRFLIPFIVNLIVLLIFGVRFTWAALLFPLTLIPLLLLGSAIGMIVGVFRVVATDLSGICDEGIRFLMFLTPIVYAPKIEISWLSTIVTYNPMTYLIGFSRDILTKGTFYEPMKFALCTLGSLLLFILAIRVFLTIGPKLLERLINN